MTNKPDVSLHQAMRVQNLIDIIKDEMVKEGFKRIEVAYLIYRLIEISKMADESYKNNDGEFSKELPNDY